MTGKGVPDDAFMTLMTSGFLAVPGVLLKEYKRLGLGDEEMMLLLQLLQFRQEGVVMPTAEQIGERMALHAEMVEQFMFNLIRLGFLEIEEHGMPGAGYEAYSLRPLYRQLQKRLEPKRPSGPSSLDMLQKKERQSSNLFALFEQEFGRPLSSMEYEHIARWIDEDRYKDEIIREALREAVLSAKFNFKYIDRILFEWQKNNIRSLQELNAYREQYRNRAPGARMGGGSSYGSGGGKGRKDKAAQEPVQEQQENKYDAFYKMYGQDR